MDNGSTDGSRQLVEQEYPEVQVVALPENLGVLRGGKPGDPGILHPLCGAAE